jgi:outer membrane immunogenic protein
MRSAILGILAAASSLSANAEAADMEPLVKAPVGSAYIPAQYLWSGYYVGFSVGWGWGNSTNDDPFTGTGGGSPRLSGFLIGGVTGVNYQIGSLVVGGEGDFTGSWAKGNIVDAAGSFLRTDVTWTSTVAARLGWAFDRVLVYGKGGGAFDHDTNTASLPDGTSDIGSTYRAGWTVGAGAEYAFTDHVIFRLAYDYLKFSTTNITYQSGGLLTTLRQGGPVNGNVGLSLSEFRGMVEYKF